MNQSEYASCYVQKSVSVSSGQVWYRSGTSFFCAYFPYKRGNMKPKMKKIYVKGRVIVAFDINVKMTTEDFFLFGTIF